MRYCEISSLQNLILLEAFAPAAVINQHGLTAEEMATKRGFRRLGVDALNGASSGVGTDLMTVFDTRLLTIQHHAQEERCVGFLMVFGIAA